METVPDGYTAVTPWIIVRDVPGFIGFARDVLGAEETVRILDEDGDVGHAEARIGGAVVMLFERKAGWPESPQFLRLYADDAEDLFRRALEADARPVTLPTDLAFGERVARFVDPWGNTWWVHQRIEEVTPERMAERWSDPVYVRNMRYVQESLRKELSARA